MNSNLAIIVASIVAGGIVIEYGVRHTRTAFAGNSSPTSSTSSAATSSATSSPAAGGKTYGQVSYDQVAAIGAQHGWTTAQIDDWFYRLIPSESNGTLNDKNPHSDAIGIAQGITGPSWYAAHGGSFDTVDGQLTAMANYIDGRFGNPSAAWIFHKANNYY